MKKLAMLLFAALLSLNCFATSDAVTVYTDELPVDITFATAGDLFQMWESEGYPDYVCGVWSTDGGMENLTIAVQNNDEGEAGKAEILTLVDDDSTVTFAYQKVSVKYLTDAQYQLLPYFEKDLGLVSAARNDLGNCIDLGILESRKDDPDTVAMLSELTEKYGDIFTVEYVSQPVTSLVDYVSLDSAVVTFDEKQNSTQYFAFLLTGVLLIATVAVLYAVRRRALVRATNAGNVTESKPSLKEVETMIKEADCTVPAELEERIMREIDKGGKVN